MRFEPLLSADPDANARALEECVQYEEICGSWWDDDDGHLPTTAELAWMQRHEQTCITGVHRDRGPSAPPPPLRLPGHSPTGAEGSPLVRQDPALIHALLESSGALERGHDYILPSGLHTDVHVNVGQVCKSEPLLRGIAAAFDAVLATETFDTVVSTGWCMATVARRLQARWEARSRHVRHLTTQGYGSTLAVLGKSRPDARVVLLLDVVVTGGLVRQLVAQLAAQGATVVLCMSLADAGIGTDQGAPPRRSLCTVPMALSHPDDCTRCGRLPSLHFNSAAFRMTSVKATPRSPAEFLCENASAREFWGLVDEAQAYEHHRREGSWHYVAFVDTLQMLRHPRIGPLLISKLSDAILAGGGCPDVVLAPGRARSHYVASRVVEALEMSVSGHQISLVTAKRYSGRLTLAPNHRKVLAGRRVLVVDAAAGHGETLDQLTMMAADAGATAVTAAVLLSRLFEPCEEALDARLSGRFVRLYSLPVAPVQRMCPSCERRIALQQAGTSLSEGPARDLARRLGTPRGYPKRPAHGPLARQLTLFSGSKPEPRSEPLGLGGYGRRVTSGIVLHALQAAKGDGMAPLSLQELFDESLPIDKRVALLEDLPPGSVMSCGVTLRSQLERYLHIGSNMQLWVAVAETLTRDGIANWLTCLPEVLERGGQWMPEPLWSRLALAAHRLAVETPSGCEQARCDLGQLVGRYSTTTAESGVRQILSSLACSDKEPAGPIDGPSA